LHLWKSKEISLGVGLDPLYLQTSDALLAQNRQADNSVSIQSMKRVLNAKHRFRFIMGAL